MIKKIKIPQSRIPVLIGQKGCIRKSLEQLTKTKITIDEEITIEGESLDILVAENIIKAIGRGFSPENAFELTDENRTILTISLPDDRKRLKRVTSRLIGTRGKARRNLERLTQTHISVFGKTVSIIGKYEDAERAGHAIEKLIDGFSHRSVYEFLEKR